MSADQRIYDLYHCAKDHESVLKQYFAPLEKEHAFLFRSVSMNIHSTDIYTDIRLIISIKFHSHVRALPYLYFFNDESSSDGDVPWKSIVVPWKTIMEEWICQVQERCRTHERIAIFKEELLSVL